VTDEPLRHWERDTDDRCPVCFVPPGAWHLAGECIYTGLWKGPEDLPGDAGAHDASGGGSGS
jgi:hypothetical protein